RGGPRRAYGRGVHPGADPYVGELRCEGQRGAWRWLPSGDVGHQDRRVAVVCNATNPISPVPQVSCERTNDAESERSGYELGHFCSRNWRRTVIAGGQGTKPRPVCSRKYETATRREIHRLRRPVEVEDSRARRQGSEGGASRGPLSGRAEVPVARRSAESTRGRGGGERPHCHLTVAGA